MSFANRAHLLVLLFIMHSISFADTLRDSADAKQLADQVMAKIAVDKMEEGVLLTKPFYTSATEAEFNVILESVKDKHPNMLVDCGKTVSTEFIREDNVGDNLLRLTYLQRCEKRPMRWVFYFYRGKNGWGLYWLFWDDDIGRMFPD